MISPLKQTPRKADDGFHEGRIHRQKPLNSGATSALASTNRHHLVLVAAQSHDIIEPIWPGELAGVEVLAGGWRLPLGTARTARSCAPRFRDAFHSKAEGHARQHDGPGKNRVAEPICGRGLVVKAADRQDRTRQDQGAQTGCQEPGDSHDCLALSSSLISSALSSSVRSASFILRPGVADRPAK